MKIKCCHLFSRVQCNNNAVRPDFCALLTSSPHALCCAHILLLNRWHDVSLIWMLPLWRIGLHKVSVSIFIHMIVYVTFKHSPESVRQIDRKYAKNVQNRQSGCTFQSLCNVICNNSLVIQVNALKSILYSNWKCELFLW